MSHQYQSLADFADWEVEAYLDGEDLPHLADFLARTPAAAATLRQEQAQQRRLQSTLYRFDCPSPATLQAYDGGELSAAAYQSVTNHLHQCPQCNAEVAAFQVFAAEPLAATTRQTTTAPAQPGLLEQLQGLVEQVRLVVATLVTPGGPQLAGVALRSAAPTAPTQLLFEADNTDVSLLIQQQANGAYRIDGQLFTAAPLAGAHYTLTSAAPDALPLTGSMTPTGAFSQTDLPAGVYQLVVKLPDHMIVAPNLSLA